MARLPRDVRPERALRALQRLGCEVVRQRSSHVVIRRVDNPRLAAVLVMHPGRALRVGNLDDLLKQLNISIEAFLEEY